MYIYVKNINKNDNNILRTIYDAIDASYFGEVKRFPKYVFGRCNNHPNEPQNIQLKSRII